jgi:hypothetical protein
MKRILAICCAFIPVNEGNQRLKHHCCQCALASVRRRNELCDVKILC